LVSAVVKLGRGKNRSSKMDRRWPSSALYYCPFQFYFEEKDHLSAQWLPNWNSFWGQTKKVARICVKNWKTHTKGEHSQKNLKKLFKPLTFANICLRENSALQMRKQLAVSCDKQ